MHRGRLSTSANPDFMFWNYLKLAIRNIRRQKVHSAVNIVGLAVGLTSFLLILVYVGSELTFDRFHDNGENLYRVNWDFRWDGSEGIGPGTPPPLAARMEQDFPEVEATTRIYPVSPTVVRFEDRFFTEERIRAVDPNFLQLFSFRLIEGDNATALQAPGSVVLTESAAARYFEDMNSLGQPITIGQSSEFLGRPYDEHFTVTGIVADPPGNSHIQFDLLTSMASHPQVEFFDWSWIWMQVVTYTQLRPGASTAELEAKMVGMVATYAPDAFKRVGFSFDEMIAAGGRWNFVLQPLRDVHLGSVDIGNRLGPVGNRTYLSIFAVLAVFILLIACVNFMNLSTARSTTRAKEIGIRKTLGSERRAVILQFLTEAMLLAAVAMLVAVAASVLLLPLFGYLAGRSFDLAGLMPDWAPLLLVGVVFVVGLMAGTYPSVFLSRFAPIEVLKGRAASQRGGTGIRNALVVFQFAISIALICCTLVVYSQIRFFGESDKGFSADGVLVVSNHNHVLGAQLGTFRELAEKQPGVRSAAVSTGVPPFYGFQDFYRAEDHGDAQFDLISYQVDDHFGKTLGIEILDGRGFSQAFGSDSASVILNESAVEMLGWESPVGKRIEYPSKGFYTVVGVMRDFNFLSMHQPISPFALFHITSKSYTIPDSYVTVHVNTDRMESTVDHLAETWESMAPGNPFEYSFLDENFEGQYDSEHRLGRLFVLFSGLAIVIACLGLFGLATFSVERRRKEIGIRKTLGASAVSVVALLSREFTRWVLVGNLVAWPVAWVAMERWLQNFAYRISLGPSPFLVAGISAILIAAATIIWQTVRAGLADPVEALHYE